MLPRLASWCYHHRRAVLVMWIAGLIGILSVSGAVGDAFATTFKINDSDAAKAFDLLSKNGSLDSNSSGLVVIKAERGLTDGDTIAKIGDLFRDLGQVPHVKQAASPFTDPTHQSISPKNEPIAYGSVTFDARYAKLPAVTDDRIRALRDQYDHSPIQVELGGPVFADQKPPGSTEAVGLIAAVFILLIAFGSLLAMGLPLLTALFGIGIGFGFVGLLSNVFEMPEFTTQLAAMIGIGVGIDYALFIVTRYRQGLRDGLDPEHSVITALTTAGSAVLFAGVTVIISLCGMFLMGIEFVKGLAVGASVVVLITMIASVTLLPAILGFVGRTIDRLTLPWSKHHRPLEQTTAYRWSHFLQRRPWPAALLGTLLLVALAIPMFDIRLGSSDDSNKPTSDTTRRAYDLLTTGFGPGFNGPLLIVAKVPDAQMLPVLEQLVPKIEADPNVDSVQPRSSFLRDLKAGKIDPTTIQRGPKDLLVLRVFPKTSPQEAATTDLIGRLRTQVIPGAIGTTYESHIGGITAIFVDIASKLQERLVIFIGAVLAFSFLLLMLVFRSVLVPLKAVLMNLLSIGAAYGVVVAIFQKGWGASLIGVGKEGPIEAFVPMMMFAILFGLSMDYEVFLLSRVKEEYDRTGDNKNAVADGLASTARVITAAAAIMVTVFGTFVLDPNRVVKEFGLGLAVAILIDATVVRMVLVPATMELLGDGNWWLPKWLRWLPQIHVDGAEVHDIATANARPRDDADGSSPTAAEPTADDDPESDAEPVSVG